MSAAKKRETNRRDKEKIIACLMRRRRERGYISKTDTAKYEKKYNKKVLLSKVFVIVERNDQNDFLGGKLN